MSRLDAFVHRASEVERTSLKYSLRHDFLQKGIDSLDRDILSLEKTDFILQQVATVLESLRDKSEEEVRKSSAGLVETQISDWRQVNAPGARCVIQIRPGYLDLLQLAQHLAPEV